MPLGQFPGTQNGCFNLFCLIVFPVKWLFIGESAHHIPHFSIVEVSLEGILKC